LNHAATAVQQPAGYLHGRTAIGIFLCFAWVYLLGYAVRSIGAIIAPNLLHDLNLTQADLGLLTAGYFVGFGIMQLPLGVMLDRYGVRRVQSVLLLFAVVGALIFAYASSFTMLWIGRALIGIGGSGSLMAAYKVFAERFPPALMPRLSAWVLMAGSTGALIATVPAAAALPVIGWRGLFVVFAVLVAIAALLIHYFAPSPLPAHEDEEKPSVLAQFAGFKIVFGNRVFWLIAPIAMMTSGAFMAVQGLWAGPWLSEVGGLDAFGIAKALLFFNLTLMAAHMIFGLVVTRLEAQGVALRSLFASGSLVALFALGWLALGGGGPSPALPWIAWAVSMATTSLTFVMLVRAFPAKLAGRVSTSLNLMTFIGAFTVQWGIGVVLDLAGDAGLARPEAFQVVFATLWVLQCLALLWLLFGPGNQRVPQA